MRIILILLAFVFVSCNANCGKNYKSLRAKCKQVCKRKQAENVGTTFMFRDIHATFGKCNCFDKEGKRISFYISVED
jgi:hypothetical protein